MGNFEWRPLLTRWSEEWLQALAANEPEEFEELDEDVVRDRWLGFAPAGPARMTALRERIRGLGIRTPLPPSLCSFLETSDGWRHAGGFVYLLAGTERIEPYGDPYGLQPMYEEHLGENPAEKDVVLAGMWGRALQLSLDSDMTDVLIDPGDVGADGEWAVYVYHGWGGEPPERYDSFRAFMEDMYKEFYQLGGSHPDFENTVTRDLDAKVEQARLVCLKGELDEALAVFDEAGELGRPRAGLLSSQLRALLNGRGSVPVDPRMDDPLYAGEVLPLRVSDHLRERRSDDTLVLGPVTEDYATDRERARVVLEQIRQRTYEYSSQGPFGRAVEEARELARWGDTDGAWRVLAAAVPLWEPYREDHVAPFGLLGDPLLGPLVTPERGRQLLTTPRAGQARATNAAGTATASTTTAAAEAPPTPSAEVRTAPEAPPAPTPSAEVRTAPEATSPPAAEAVSAAEAETLEPAAEATPPGAGLGWLAHSHRRVGPLRESYRFVLVEGMRPEELAERFGAGPLEPVASETDLWHMQFVRQHERRGPMARVGARGGWSFAFESAHRLTFDASRLTDPGTGLSQGARALTVWCGPGLFHFAFAEDGEQRYAFTVHQAERHRTGTPPAALSPDQLFPDPAGPATDRSDDARALDAIAAAFQVSLPEFALEHGRLPTLPTRPWIRPPGPGEGYTAVSITLGGPHGAAGPFHQGTGGGG
ncbi:SMI1/KNR4 family protein [Streptomyces sp. 5-8]|uniref:SMI1/KNR4 family protein n=1 Tax=Streptomyces musisoli TaxID=2802280 RepID=A0ABS1NWE0_9ACTN|nr:SMI1/KNR4 family protein [Streptomyces musisoli]MBL1104418.1 SMI1/KNR4 family protein [Streptomyces musisoli]